MIDKKRRLELQNLISEYLLNYKYSKYLNLKGKSINNKEIQYLLKIISHHTEISAIDLTLNQIHSIGLRDLFRFLEHSNSIQSLNLSSNKFNDYENSSFSYISSFLKKNNSLTHLDLSNNRLGVPGLNWLNYPINILYYGANLYHYNDKYQSFAHFKKDLKNVSDKTVILPKIIDSFYATFGYKAIKALTDGIYYNKSLKKLILKNNNIDDFGISIFSSSLKQNKSIKVLDLSNNDITDVGIKILAKAIEKNKSIEYINLSGNNLTCTGIEILLDLKRKNKNLKFIDLYNQKNYPNDKIDKLINLDKNFHDYSRQNDKLIRFSKVSNKWKVLNSSSAEEKKKADSRQSIARSKLKL